ncbi:MAG: FAD:protein FMN transferase [Verrucomicrobiota bacterium]|nr:FAD:protein FMN transferase [Verrucomicrobiota bacterium]
MKHSTRHGIRGRIGAVACVCLALLTVGGCREKELARSAWETMGTFAGITAPADEAARLAEYTAAARAACGEIEEQMSLFKPDGDIARLNRSAGAGVVTMATRTLAVLREALRYSEASDGAFDPTIAPVVRLWGFNNSRAPEQLPDRAAISNALTLVGWRRLALGNDTAALALPGMSVDLGGIAKGYAVDACYDRLRAMGATNFMVNLGGNIRVGGSPWRGEPWTIGVRNPFKTDEVLGTIRLTNGMAVGTSGNYERFVTVAGRKYAHIMDPRTGCPVEGMAGVTLVATNGIQSDGLSKPLFILGPDDSKHVLKRFPSLEALFVPDRQPVRLRMTPGFRAIFTPAPEWADREEPIAAWKQ